MDRLSLFKLSGLPESFGVIILVFSLILLLAPYFSGTDFGLFKIPNVSEGAKKLLRIVGPVLFIFSILFFVPIFSSNQRQPMATPSPIQLPTPSPQVTSSSNPSSSPKSSLSPLSDASNRGSETEASSQQRTMHKLEITMTGTAQYNSVYLAGEGSFKETAKTVSRSGWFINPNQVYFDDQNYQYGSNSTQTCEIWSTSDEVELSIQTDYPKNANITIETKAGPFRFEQNVHRKVSLVSGFIK